jgi:hypothetical protein
MDIAVANDDVLADGPLGIRIKGVGPRAWVEFELGCEDASGARWSSRLDYRADPAGIVDLDRDDPLDPPHPPLAPAMPIWAMESCSADRVPVNFTTPAGPIALDIRARCRGEAREARAVRRWGAPDSRVERVDGPGFCGWFYGADGGTGPAVAVTPGSTGPDPLRPLAALLAAHGHPTLLIAYTGEPGLPDAMVRIPVEVVGAALDAVRMRGGRSAVAALSASVGTQGMLAALALGAAHAAGAIAIAPSSVIWQGLAVGGGRPPAESSWSHVGVPLPWLRMRSERILPGLVLTHLRARVSRRRRSTALRLGAAYGAALSDVTGVARAAIPVEQIACPLLLASGDEDAMWPGSRMADAIMERRRDAGVGDRDRLLRFSGAGHFIRPPIVPTTVDRSAELVSGGRPAGTARAQSETWAAILRFLDGLVHAA